VKEAILDVMNPVKQDKEDLSSDSEQEEAPAKDKKQKKMKGIPRKNFKRMIKKELDKKCQEIFKEMINTKEAEKNEDADQISSCDKKDKNQVVHNATCNGCGNGITGVRYKCSVCKNFDFCTTCEERRGHKHAFLKIYNSMQVPKAMFTVIDESMENAQADIEQDIGENNTFFRNSKAPANVQNSVGMMVAGLLSGFQQAPQQKGKGKKEWNMKKAMVVSLPEKLTARPGETMFASVEIKNDKN